MKKYEFTGEEKVIDNHTLHRIRAVRDFGTVKAGDLGGWIEKEENLSHDGDAWVGDNAQVTGAARVISAAQVIGDAWVDGNALVGDNAQVIGAARVIGDARVGENAWVTGAALVGENALVGGAVRVTDNAQVIGAARVIGSARVTGNALVGGAARVGDNAQVIGAARVTGNALVGGAALVGGVARVTDDADFSVISGFGIFSRATTFFRCQDGKIRTQSGCFYGDLDEFRAKVKETHGESKMAKEYLMIADLMEMHFASEE